MNVGDFFAQTMSNFNPLLISITVFAIVVLFLVKMRANAPTTLMVAVIALALIGGFQNNLLGVSIPGINSIFFPAFAFTILIAGGVLAYAFWRLLT